MNTTIEASQTITPKPKNKRHAYHLKYYHDHKVKTTCEICGACGYFSPTKFAVHQNTKKCKLVQMETIHKILMNQN